METQKESQESTSPLFNFGTAIDWLKKGALVQRKGWNGKGMFLFMRPEFQCGTDLFATIQSVPTSAKKAIMEVMSPEATFKFTPYISMFAADQTIVNGWLASQTDILANDWQLYTGLPEVK